MISNVNQTEIIVILIPFKLKLIYEEKNNFYSRRHGRSYFSRYKFNETYNITFRKYPPFYLSKRHDSNEYLYLRIHSSTSAGSQTFSTVQFEYQKGKLPFSNILPFGHLYFENSLSYHNQPPSSIGGGRSAQGSTETSYFWPLVH